ncbi:MAG TPA: hypothetical protein DIU15_07895 [Deltaproteobacteria bacterium]|nr:hypothetical protein [Deltaproteobacteria bacterium]HCP45947.1 hypothetical protein [Deltaproteobacteria bacterium]
MARPDKRLSELEQRYDRLRRSVLLFRELASTTRSEAFYARLLSGLANEFEVSAGFFGKVQGVGGCVAILASLERVSGQLPSELPLAHPLVRQVLGQEERCLILTSREEAPAGSFVHSGSESSLAVKCRLESDEPELLILESRSREAFSEEDGVFVAELLETLEKTLFNRYSRSRSDREIGLLLDVARGEADLQRALDESELSSLLQKLLEVALSRTHCRHGAVLLVDEDSQDLHMEAETFSLDLNQRIPRVLKRRADRPSGVVFRVMSENRHYLANDTSQDPYYTQLLSDTRAALAVPMSFQDRCIGVILVESQQEAHFTPDHVAMLDALAQTATSFVRRAQLYRSTQMDQEKEAVLIKGRGPAWDDVERRIERAADTNATVCLRGESGTGKELVAHAIHFNSNRQKAPFVTVNCAAIPFELLESELFGHVKGAFTGAVVDRAGQFEVADGGTIFLDEIGDLPPALQVKLLRVLQSAEVRKVGSDQVRRVDVRVIAATSRDLEAMMGQGLFREDLYYRLMVVPTHLPPLREYPESIPGMVRQFLRDANVAYGRSVAGVEDDALQALCGHSYPGNVRELRNIVEQAVLLSEGSWIRRSDLPGYLRGEESPPPMPGSLAPPGQPNSVAPVQPPLAVEALGAATVSPPSPLASVVGAESLESALEWDYKTLKAEMLRRFESQYLDSLLEATGGNVTRAAELAGIHRVNIHRMLKRRSEH